MDADTVSGPVDPAGLVPAGLVPAGADPAGVVDEAVRRAPAPPLRGLVGWYSGYRQTGVPPTSHRGLPSPYLTLILTLDDPLTVTAHPDPGDPPGDYRTLLGGLHISPALIHIPGRQSGIQVALGPIGARVALSFSAVLERTAKLRRSCAEWHAASPPHRFGRRPGSAAMDGQRC